MKNTILPLFLSVFLCGMAFSQGDKTERIYFGNHHLPSNPLPKEYTSYSIKALAVQNHVSQINGRLRIAGYSSVSSGGDIEITFQEKPFSVLKAEGKTREAEVEKDGVKTKVTYYYASLIYEHGTSMTVHDKNGEELLKTELISESYRESNTREFSSYKELNDNLKAIYKDIEESEFNDCLTNGNAILNNTFGFPVENVTLTLYSVKPKKFSYDKFNQGSAMAINAIRQIDTLNRSIANPKDHDFSDFSEDYSIYLDSLKMAVSLWEEELKESNIDDRKARIDKELTLDLNLNIAAAFFVMKKFDEAFSYSEKAVALGRMNGSSTYMRQNSLDTKANYSAYYPGKF